MGESIRLSVCVLLVISVLWKTASSEECSLACKGSSSAPTFLNGHKYMYGVEGIVSIFLTSADKQETSVKLLGQVAVIARGNCVNELKVQNLVISGPDGKKYGSPPGIDKPIRFTLQDGKLGPEICAEADDTRRSLNIKRAIISLLQTENKPSTQVDVFGACPTEASSSQEGPAVLVHRTRDLSRCAHREQGKNDLITGIYNPTAEIKNTQVLQSTLHVESKVNNGVPEKVAATEEYLYKPFSIGENGARAKVLTKLTLNGNSADSSPPGKYTQTRTVIFENPHGYKTSGTADSALTAIKDTAKAVQTEASSTSAGEFAQLVRILRTVGKEDLMKIYGQVKGNNLQKRVFLDGLLRAGTGYSVEASIEILKGKDLSNLEQQLVFLSLGNAKHVNNEAIKGAASLLDLPNLPKEVYLGVGALAGTFCRDHNCHHVKNEGITALSQKFGAKIKDCKPKTKVEEDFVVAILKGVRNIHHLEDNLIDKLVRCANDNNVKPRVRVAALEAFGADPCSAKLKKTAIELMKNRQLDSEIRIKAYLAIIQCPCAGSATEIKNLLETEPVHQVGRFITSSLRHIRSSSNPDKFLARQHYGQIGTPNRFNVDDRKYSFYREMSYNVDALGIGGSAEETIIYSQDSFLPRSGSLNLTAELFGHNVNVLEIGGRQGNLDRVIEHFLGPKGIFHSEKPQELYDNFIRRFSELEKKAEEGLTRGRRSIKTEVDNFDKHLKAESVPFNNELDLDIYVKLFGTDAVFLSLGDDKGIDLDSLLERAMKVLNGGINQLKHFNQEIRAHLLFLDAELAYPTSTGLPLKLDLVGSATGRLDIATNIDLRQILRNPKNAKLDIKLIPSTDIEVAGLFIVDADAVATGIKVSTNLHTSTGAHVIAKVLEDGQGIDLQFGLPIDKQEIITASNDVYYVTAEKGHKGKRVPVKIDTDRKEYSGCFDQLSGMLGLTLCGEVSIPFSVSGPEAQASISKFIGRFPLTGPSKLKVYLEKNDLRGYHIKGILRRDNPQRQGFELLFEAEGSKNRRTSVSGELIRNNDENTLRLALESPIKSMSGQVSYYTKPSERLLLIKANVDRDEYYAKAGFNVQGNDRRAVYKPIIEYQLPGDRGKQSLKVDGQLIREANGPVVKYTVEGIKITMPSSNEVIDLNGHFNQEPRGMELDLKAKRGDHNAMIAASLKGHDAKVEFQNTLNPYVNFRINGHFENADSQYHNDIDLRYGPDLNNQQTRVIFNQLLKYSKDFNIITKNKFEIMALPLKVKLNAEVDRKKVDMEVEGQYMNKKGKFEIEARTQIKKPGDWNVKVDGEFDRQGIEIFSKRDIVSADKSNFENYVQIKNIAKYELSGVVMHRTKANDLNVGANGHLKISGGGKDEDIKFDIGAIENANMYSSHAKVSSSKGELLNYLLKITRGPNASGELKFMLKDTVAANGNFKVTDNDGKGNGLVIIDFKKSQRKIKGDVKFVVKDPVYNMDVDLFLNFEKDNNDKVHLSTNTKRTPKLIDSKNKLVYAGQKTELNIHRDGPVFSNGKSHGSVELVLPTERVLSLKLDHDMDSKDDNINGHHIYVLSDAVKRGGPASTITFKSKVIDTNVEKEKLHMENELEIKLKDGRMLHNTFFVKNIPDGDKYKYELKYDVKGNLIPKPASLSVNGEGINSVTVGNEQYRLKASYGDDIGVELIGSLDYNALDKDKKYIEKNTLNIRLPFEKAHDIRIMSNIVFLKPDSRDVIAEYTIIESVQVNADQYKLDASGKIGLKQGYTKMKVLVPHVDPMVLDVNYKADIESDTKSGSVEIKSQYGKGKTATIAAGAQIAPREYKMQIQALAPQAEKLKKLELQLTGKNPSPDTYSASATLDADGRVYGYDVMTVYSKVNPVIDIKFRYPNSPNGRIFFKGTAISSNQGKVEVKFDNIRDYSLDMTSEANIQKDNVAIKIAANSEKFGLKNYKVDIMSKDAGSGKRLEFHATNDNKNVLSGSTSFISKQEGTKTIVEGSGSVKVREEQKSANFKYIRTLLTEGSEQGVETFLNLAIGERSYVAESRVTNVEYKTNYVYCEEKKQCANVEVQSKVQQPSPGTFQHVVNVGFDLRKLGFAPEFGLQILNEVSEKKLPQYTLDLHVNKEDKKYYLHVYSQPEHGKFPAGITVTLPHRVLALEYLVTYPTNKAMPFPIKGEVALHMDKNKPQQKTAARFMIDVSGDQTQHGANAEFGLMHPKLGREFLVKFRGHVQRPNENSIKIDSLATVSHPTIIGKDREAKLYLEANPNHIKFLLNTPIVKVIDLDGSVTIQENLQKGDLTFSLLEGKPVRVSSIVKDYKYFEFTTGYTDESQRKLSVIGHIEPEKRVDISADIVLPNEKKNIIHGALFIQDNLIKSDYGVSKDNFQYFVNALQNDLKNLEQRIKTLGEKASNDFKNTLKRVEPTFKQLEQAYKEDLEKLYKEISNDKALKEISDAIYEVAKYLAKMADDVITAFRPIVENVVKTITDTCKKICEMYEKQIEPQFKQFYANMAAMVKEYLEGVLDLVAHFAALISDFFEKHKPELQELTNTLAEIFKDLTRLIVAQMKEVRGRLTQIFSEIFQQIKELPIFGILKEKWEELAVPEQALQFMETAFMNIRQLLPTEESRKFADIMYRYVVKKLRQEKVDDAKELRAIYQEGIAAINSLITFIRAQAGQFGLPTFININPLSLLSGHQAFTPAFGGIPTFSLLNQLIKGDIPDPLSIIRAYRPRSINPLEEIPTQMRGVIVNGQHIFTFDGRHLTFPGNCRYVLAHDYVDRNFSLVLQLQNGSPKVLVLEDKSGTTIELKENGQVALNGVAHGFPVIEKDVFAFREPSGRIGLGSRYGLMAFCTTKLEVCYIEISGFYLGKLRGLLGDGNNEPYDDFRMPNGKITDSESEFGNSYRLATSCPQVKSPEHSHHQHHAALPPACEQVFGGSSPLRPLALLLDAAPFRQACIHAVGSDSANALHQACDLGRGYAALAVTGMLPAVLPSVCVQCNDVDTPKNVGDTYTVRLPSKQADVVVAVETTKDNEKNYKDLVVPLVSQIVDMLKSKQISDIKVYLVGITPKMPYPILYDTDLKLRNAKIQFDDTNRNELPRFIQTGYDKIDNAQVIVGKIVEAIKRNLGLTNVVSGYRSIMDLPLRPGALKHTINVVGEQCMSRFFLTEFMRALAYRAMFDQMAYTHSLVTITPDMKIGGGKDPHTVVGFTDDAVLLLGDKKQTKDSEALRPTLEIRDDACIDFVESTDGIVLSATNYLAMNPGQQKQFLQTATAAISSKLLSHNYVQECTCTYVDPFRVRSICVTKERKEMGRRRK